jgi:NAD(P)H-dependent FMN reductase
VLHLDLRTALLLGVPLLLLGALSGALRALSRNPALAPRRRRLLQAAWVLVLLAGVPLWLVLAAALKFW